METRANYIAVGIFTLTMLVVAMALVYWFGRYGDDTSLVPLDVRIQGSVSGLGPGSAVQFNGIDVGRVEALSLDSSDPRYVIVHTQVNSATPVRADTRATIGIRGLSGGAFIQLEGGSPEAKTLISPTLSNQLMASGDVPQISGDPAALSDVINRVNNIAARTERVMGTLEIFVNKNEATVTRTLNNAEAFSQALADNSDGVSKFLSSAGDVAVSLQSLSDKLDGSVARVEKILNAVEPESVGRTVKNVELFTQTLAEQREQISATVTSVNDAAEQLNQFSNRLGQTLGKIDKVVESVEPEKVQNIVASLDQSVAKVARVVGAVDEAKVAKVVDDISATTAQARSTVQSVDQIVQSVDKEALRSLVTDLSTASRSVATLMAAIDATKVNEAVDNISKAANGAQSVVADAKQVSSTIAGRTQDINKIITDAAQLSAQLNATSKRIDGVVEQASNFFGSGATDGLVADARKTLQDFRTAAQNFSVQVGQVARGINNFTRRGLGDTQSLIRDARQSINRVDRVIRNLESNPSALISGAGGSRIRESSGGRARR